MWEKWALLASFGAVTCLMDGTIGEVARTQGGVEFVNRLFAEVSTAIASSWQALSEGFEQHALGILTDRNSTLTSSMYRDLKAGLRVEVGQILGDLVSRAAADTVAKALLCAALGRLKVYEERRLSMQLPPAPS